MPQIGRPSTEQTQRLLGDTAWMLRLLSKGSKHEKADTQSRPKPQRLADKR